jgi:hypothetical protein
VQTLQRGKPAKIAQWKGGLGLGRDNDGNVHIHFHVELHDRSFDILQGQSHIYFV